MILNQLNHVNRCQKPLLHETDTATQTQLYFWLQVWNTLEHFQREKLKSA